MDAGTLAARVTYSGIARLDGQMYFLMAESSRLETELARECDLERSNAGGSDSRGPNLEAGPASETGVSKLHSAGLVERR